MVRAGRCIIWPRGVLQHLDIRQLATRHLGILLLYLALGIRHPVLGQGTPLPDKLF